MTNTAWLQDDMAVATITFDVDAETPILAAGSKYAGDVMAMSHQGFGPDVGVPRILDMLDQVEIRSTFFVPGWVAETRPGLCDTLVQRGHEVAHHSYSHRSPSTMTPAEERNDFVRGLEVFEAQGIPISGYRAAMWEATVRTPSMLAEHGLLYDSSMMADDRPYRITTSRGVVSELPVHWSLDDWEQYAFLPEPRIGNVIESPLKVLEMWDHELRAAEEFHTLFNLCSHPFLTGRAGRLVALRTLLERAQERGSVRFSTCHDLAVLVAADEGARMIDESALLPDTSAYPFAR
jgi:peptidoglycan/xylan/chitin deacetylase (PgdA/CDA1 family)